ncbi:hypothetical protein [Pseudoduganella albidiflava]|nr:hypothetical protein [Pseudoduganella albidiflava]
MMAQSKSTGNQNKQSATEAEATSTPSNKKAKSGKEAASHTKAGGNEGAGGGKKQARKH